MRRVLLSVLVVAGTMLIAAVPAGAGGPTSVLLTNPDQGRATALYVTDPQYAELDSLLHGAGSAARGTGAETPDQLGAAYLNVTWLAHDVSVWRTEQVVVGLDDSAWVATWDALGEGPMSSTPNWTPLDHGDRIRELMVSLGLIGPGRGTADADSEAAVASPEPATTPTTVIREETRWFTLTGWRWAVPGLLLGLLAAAVVRGRGSGSARPRQELIDELPERVTSPG